MMDLQLRLCVGDAVVPLVAAALYFADLHEVCGEADGVANWDLLSLGAGQCNGLWLQKALGFGCKWWREQSRSLPLLKEILDAVNAKKVTKGRAGRMPRQQSFVTAIKIRDKVLYVKNCTNTVVLAFKQTEDPLKTSLAEDIKWILTEIKKDLDEQAKEPPAPKAKRQRPSTPPVDDEPELIKKSIQDLKAHANCKSATWLPSRNEFRVVRDADETQKALRLVGLSRARQRCEGRSAAELETLYDSTVASVIAFLEGQLDPPEPLEDQPEPLADEGAPPEHLEDQPDPLADDGPMAEPQDEEQHEALSE